MRKCQACGSEQLSYGRLVSTGKHAYVYGRPMIYDSEDDKGNSEITGIACLECGHLELKVNQVKLKA
jgi:hypothetical protein